MPSSYAETRNMVFPKIDSRVDHIGMKNNQLKEENI
jgi:hypothetical protein